MSSFGNRFKFSPTRYEELDAETSLMTSEEQVALILLIMILLLVYIHEEEEE